MKKLFVGLALALFAWGAQAQDALVVTTCGTLPTPYTAGSSRLPTVDVNGKLCLSVSSATNVTAAAVLTQNQIVVGADGARGVKSADTTITGDYSFSGQIINGQGTITTSKPFTLTETWNAAGVTFSAATISVTPTAFTTASRFLDLQSGATSLARFELIGSGIGTDYLRLSMPRSVTASTIVGTLDYNGGQWNLGSTGVSATAVAFKNNSAVQKFTFDTSAAGLLTLASDMGLGFSGTTTANFANVMQFSRAADGIFSVDTSAIGDGKGSIRRSYAIGSLPAAPKTGAMALTTDQITACPVPGVAPTAGGALVCPVFYNGAAWVGG